MTIGEQIIKLCLEERIWIECSSMHLCFAGGWRLASKEQGEHMQVRGQRGEKVAAASGGGEW
jgi:hypothetical protein